MKRIALVLGLGLLSFGILQAQEVPRFAFNFGGGVTQPMSHTADELNEGWNAGVGVGFNFSQWVGVMVDVNYNRFGVNSFVLNNLGFPDGNVGVFSATLDPIIHLTPRSVFDLYVIGGGGIYHRNQQFTQPGVATVTAFDPFFGFYPVDIPTNEVLSSFSVNKPGFDVGAGIAIGTKWHGKVFAEARYNRIFLSTYGHMDYIPVTFGLRW